MIDGHPSNVSRRVKATIRRAHKHGLVVTATTDPPQGAPGASRRRLVALQAQGPQRQRLRRRFRFHRERRRQAHPGSTPPQAGRVPARRVQIRETPPVPHVRRDSRSADGHGSPFGETNGPCPRVPLTDPASQPRPRRKVAVQHRPAEAEARPGSRHRATRRDPQRPHGRAGGARRRRPRVARARVVEQESGGRNVFGHDPTSSVPAAWKGGKVTRARYLQYKRNRASGGMQGVGPFQLTWWEFQDRADLMGGCWVPRNNIRVGLQILRANIAKHGRFAGIAAYNGTGDAAQNYARFS
jgi:hypothetical protein